MNNPQNKHDIPARVGFITFVAAFVFLLSRAEASLPDILMVAVSMGEVAALIAYMSRP